MNLIPCPECGKERTSQHNEPCPHCGHRPGLSPNQLIAGLLLASALCWVGCEMQNAARGSIRVGSISVGIQTAAGEI